jgi:hypothetical protein
MRVAFRKTTLANSDRLNIRIDQVLPVTMSRLAIPELSNSPAVTTSGEASSIV